MSDFGEKVQRNYLKEVHQHCERITGIANEMYERGEGFRGRCLEQEKASDEMLRHLDETATTVEDISEGRPTQKGHAGPVPNPARATAPDFPGAIPGLLGGESHRKGRVPGAGGKGTSQER